MKFKKVHILFFPVLLLVLLCFSCSNVNQKETTCISLDAGAIFEIARNYSREAEGNSEANIEENEEAEYEIFATITTADKKSETEYLTSKSEEDINEKEMQFKNVPLGETVSIEIQVYKNDIVMFTGQKEIFVDIAGKEVVIVLIYCEQNNNNQNTTGDNTGSTDNTEITDNPSTTGTEQTPETGENTGTSGTGTQTTPTNPKTVLKVQSFVIQQMNDIIRVTWSYTNNPEIKNVIVSYAKDGKDFTPTSINPTETTFDIQLDEDEEVGTVFNVKIKYEDNEGNFSDEVLKTISITKIKKDFSGWQVGDVILKDTTRIPYCVDLEYTEDQKANAVAVIIGFIDGVPLGMGLKQSGKIKWTPFYTTGYETLFEKITVTYSGDNKYSRVFEGDTNGQDNWEEICKVDPTGTESSVRATNYPVFNYALTYGNTASLQETKYYNDWYIPSVAELYEVYKNKTVINKVLTNIGGTTMPVTTCWTSSQNPNTESYQVYGINFQHPIEDGGTYADITQTSKANAPLYTRVIRRFE